MTASGPNRTFTTNSSGARQISIDKICVAISEEDFDLVRRLVSDVVDLNVCGKHGHTPLTMAAETESIAIAQYLIERGADVNFAGYKGATPLHHAVDISIDGTIQTGGSYGDEPLEMIQCLLANGADTGIVDSGGKTALNRAEDYKSKKVVNALKIRDSE